MGLPSLAQPEAVPGVFLIDTTLVFAHNKREGLALLLKFVELFVHSQVLANKGKG